MSYINGGSGALAVVVGVEDEGVDQGSPLVLDFVGTGVTVTTVDGLATISIPGGTSGIETLDEGIVVGTAQTELNFVGAGVSAASVGARTTVTIAGGAGGGSLDDIIAAMVLM